MEKEQAELLAILLASEKIRDHLEEERSSVLEFLDSQIQKLQQANKPEMEQECWQVRASVIGGYDQILKEVEDRIAKTLEGLGLSA